MSSNLKFFFKAVPGERIETALTLPEDDRSSISGRCASGRWHTGRSRYGPAV